MENLCEICDKPIYEEMEDWVILITYGDERIVHLDCYFDPSSGDCCPECKWGNDHEMIFGWERYHD